MDLGKGPEACVIVGSHDVIIGKMLRQEVNLGLTNVGESFIVYP